LYIYLQSPWTFFQSHLCILSSNNTPLIYWWNCYPWHSIGSRSSPTHQRCFNSFSSYRTLIDMKPFGLVVKFHKWNSFKNSAISSIYSKSYAGNFGGSRICQHCWHSHLV
jgi:hypothetical protein